MQPLARGRRECRGVVDTWSACSGQWPSREGEKRSVIELEVDEVGASLGYATAKINKRKANRTNTSNDSSDRSGELVGAATGNRKGGDDPWASTGSGFGGGEEPPF